MFLCKVKLRPPLHHIVFAVLLLAESSFTAAVNDTLTATASVQHNSTQCLSCDKGNVSSNAAVDNSTASEAPTLPSATNLTITITKTSDAVKSTLTVSTDRPSLQPKTPDEPPALIPTNSSAPTARTQTSAATANRADNASLTTSLVTSDSRVTTASTTSTTHALHGTTTKTANGTKSTATSVKNSAITMAAKTTATHTTTTTTKTSTSSPSSSSSSPTLQQIQSTRLPLASTTIVITLPSTTTVSSATTPETTTSHSKLAPSETTAAMVEVLGDALSKQLASTALLLGVLVCGSLLFVITVMLFVKQAYESYNRKDYSQVDYLINGMYSDSSV